MAHTRPADSEELKLIWVGKSDKSKKLIEFINDPKRYSILTKQLNDLKTLAETISVKGQIELFKPLFAVSCHYLELFNALINYTKAQNGIFDGAIDLGIQLHSKAMDEMRVITEKVDTLAEEFKKKNESSDSAELEKFLSDQLLSKKVEKKNKELKDALKKDVIKILELDFMLETIFIFEKQFLTVDLDLFSNAKKMLGELKTKKESGNFTQKFLVWSRKNADLLNKMKVSTVLLEELFNRSMGMGVSPDTEAEEIAFKNLRRILTELPPSSTVSQVQELKRTTSKIGHPNLSKIATIISLVDELRVLETTQYAAINLRNKQARVDAKKWLNRQKKREEQNDDESYSDEETTTFDMLVDLPLLDALNQIEVLKEYIKKVKKYIFSKDQTVIVKGLAIASQLQEILKDNNSPQALVAAREMLDTLRAIFSSNYAHQFLNELEKLFSRDTYLKARVKADYLHDLLAGYDADEAVKILGTLSPSVGDLEYLKMLEGEQLSKKITTASLLLAKLNIIHRLNGKIKAAKTHIENLRTLLLDRDTYGDDVIADANAMLLPLGVILQAKKEEARQLLKILDPLLNENLFAKLQVYFEEKGEKLRASLFSLRELLAEKFEKRKTHTVQRSRSQGYIPTVIESFASKAKEEKQPVEKKGLQPAASSIEMPAPTRRKSTSHSRKSKSTKHMRKSSSMEHLSTSAELLQDAPLSAPSIAAKNPIGPIKIIRTPNHRHSVAVGYSPPSPMLTFSRVKGEEPSSSPAPMTARGRFSAPKIEIAEPHVRQRSNSTSDAASSSSFFQKRALLEQTLAKQKAEEQLKASKKSKK